ncbi:hypothetical protein I317_07975 [Kwoniella heveanensis CBS 569]|nr:hypothetical protein I317_07975 [Kwoniella heveanensis CBS 569]
MGLRPSPSPSLADGNGHGPGPPLAAAATVIEREEQGGESIQLQATQSRPRIRLRLRPRPVAASPSSSSLSSQESVLSQPVPGEGSSSSPTGTHSTLPLSLSQSSLETISSDEFNTANTSLSERESVSGSGSGGPTPPTSPLPDQPDSMPTRKKRRKEAVDGFPEPVSIETPDADHDMGSDSEYLPPPVPRRSTIIRIPVPATRTSSASATLLRGGGKKPIKSRRGTAGANKNDETHSSSTFTTPTSSSSQAHRQKQTSTRRTTRSKARRANSPSDLITTSLEEIAIEDAAVKSEVARLGLCLRDVKGDGNCLFRVLSDQGFGGEKRHAEIRKLVCDYLESHKNVMEGFVVPFMKDGEGYEGYVARMRQLKQFGSHIEIQAAARVFKRNIRVVMSTTSFTIPWRTEAVPDVAATPTPSEVGPVDPSSSSTPARRHARSKQQNQPSPESIAQAAFAAATADYLPSTKEDRGMLWLALFSQAEHFQSIRRMGDREHGPAEVEDRLAVPHQRDVSEAARRERGELIDEKKKIPMSESSKLQQLFASLPPGHGISDEYAQGILSKVKGDIGEAVEILLEEIDGATEPEGEEEGEIDRGSFEGSNSSERVETILSSPPVTSPDPRVHARDHAMEQSAAGPSEAIPAAAPVDPHPSTTAAAASIDRRISDYRSHSRSKSKSTSPSNSHSTATTSTESRSISLSISSGSRSESETESRSRSRSNSAVSSFSSTDMGIGGHASASAPSSVSTGSLKRKNRSSKTKELSHDLEGMGLLSGPPGSQTSATTDQSMDVEMFSGVARTSGLSATPKSDRTTPARVQRRERGDKERRRSARLGIVGA